MNQSAVVHRALRTAAALAVTVSLAGGIPVAASAHAAKDPHQSLFLKARTQALRKWPALSHAALAQVKGKPLIIQIWYLQGAILGNLDYDACVAAQLAPAKFDAIMLKDLRSGQDPTGYITSLGLTDSYTVSMFRQGTLYGCKFFG